MHSFLIAAASVASAGLLCVITWLLVKVARIVCTIHREERERLKMFRLINTPKEEADNVSIDEPRRDLIESLTAAYRQHRAAAVAAAATTAVAVGVALLLSTYTVDSSTNPDRWAAPSPTSSTPQRPSDVTGSSRVQKVSSPSGNTASQLASAEATSRAPRPSPTPPKPASSTQPPGSAETNPPRPAPTSRPEPAPRPPKASGHGKGLCAHSETTPVLRVKACVQHGR